MGAVMTRRLASWSMILWLLAGATARAEPPHAADHRRRSTALTATGAAFTAIGVGLILAVPIALTQTRGDRNACGDLCFLDNLFNAGAVAGAGSVALGVGIPLLAVGASEAKHGAQLTSVAVRSENGGATVSLSGRF
jgi:hypothetical protein